MGRSPQMQMKSVIQLASIARPALLQRACACGKHAGNGGECEECKHKRAAALQRSAVDAGQINGVPPIVHEVLRTPGQPLDNSTRAFMEPRFGYDFSHVRVHTDSKAAESAHAVGALAYTVGHDVAFGDSQYSPNTNAGRRLLAHELTHTIQQEQGILEGAQMADTLQIGEPWDIYEQEAEAQATIILTKSPDRTISPIKPTYESMPVLTRALLLQRQGNPTSKPPEAYELNTELGGLSVGNFDFYFRECQVIILVWVAFQFETDITAAERAAFKARFINAVHKVWAHTGYSLSGVGNCPCSSIPIEIHVQESAVDSYHKLVDVERERGRENVISDINVGLNTTDYTIGHEFGHVLGLYDEYDGGFFENLMFWHRNRPDDPKALMNEGSELRPRYFEQFRRRVQETAHPDCVYRISSSVPPVH